MEFDVELENVTKSFGAQIAVDAVSFRVPRGSFFSLLGPSGCGKSTTLRMVSGFEQPDSGVLRIAGENMNRVPPYRRPTNMVFQRWALFPHMTVFDNVAFGPSTKRVPAPERRKKSPKLWNWSTFRPLVSVSRASSPAARCSASRWHARW